MFVSLTLHIRLYYIKHFILAFSIPMNEEDKFYLELGKRIRKARINQNLTQKQLAELLSLNRTSITNMERGIQRLLAHTVVTIANELKVPVETILPTRIAATNGADNLSNLLGNVRSAQERKFLRSALSKMRKT